MAGERRRWELEEWRLKKVEKWKRKSCRETEDGNKQRYIERGIRHSLRVCWSQVSELRANLSCIYILPFLLLLLLSMFFFLFIYY